ncbi:glycosyltransferase family 25 protein [Streptomyces chilikensis]|uniref:Glycosyltransferase n=1 Tax=Streptomyces chilikensis TaxID=1194079 RepID=A0ABV3EJ67_9ACTN
MPKVPATLTGLPTYAVSLEHRTDRWELLASHMADLELPAPVRWLGVNGPAVATDQDLASYRRNAPCGRATLAGCWGSNVSFTRLMEYVQEQGHEWALLLEDDAFFHPHVHARYAAFAERVPEDAEIVMLGGCHQLPPMPVDPDSLVLRGMRMTCCTGYLVSRQVVPKLLAANTPRRKPFDVMWWPVHLEGHTYAPNPQLIVQRTSHSDIGGRVVTRTFRQYGRYVERPDEQGLIDWGGVRVHVPSTTVVG